MYNLSLVSFSSMDSIELAFVISSLISTALSMSVLITALIFPVMRKRLFMQIIIYISFCDVLASAASSFGFVPGQSIFCPIQSFFVVCFYKASWLWTCALTHQLYSVVISGKFGLKQYQMHLICWLIPIGSTLLPITTNPFGREDDTEPLGWCFLVGSQRNASLWGGFSLELVLFGSVAFMTFFLLRIYCRYRSVNMQKVYPEVYAILDALMLYPPGFFLTWGPNLIFALLFYVNAVEATTEVINAFNIVTILATQSGSVLAIIFFIKSREARYRWTALLCGRQERYNSSNQSNSMSASDIPVDFKNEDKFAFDDIVPPSELLESEVYGPYDMEDTYASPFREFTDADDSVSSLTMDERFSSVEAPSIRNSEVQMKKGGDGWTTTQRTPE